MEASGIDESSFGQVEFGLLMENSSMFVQQAVVHAREREREIWLEIENRAISMKRSLKPQELIRSLRRSGWSSILLCSSQKRGLWMSFKEFTKWVQNLKKSPIFTLNTILV